MTPRVGLSSQQWPQNARSRDRVFNHHRMSHSGHNVGPNPIGSQQVRIWQVGHDLAGITWKPLFSIDVVSFQSQCEETLLEIVRKLDQRAGIAVYALGSAPDRAAHRKSGKAAPSVAALARDSSSLGSPLRRRYLRRMPLSADWLHRLRASGFLRRRPAGRRDQGGRVPTRPRPRRPWSSRGGGRAPRTPHPALPQPRWHDRQG